MEAPSLNDNFGRLSRNCRERVARFWRYYLSTVLSRQHWVNYASQSLHNPYIALGEMFFVHPGAARGALSRLIGNVFPALGTTSAYSGGRDTILKKFGIFDRDSIPKRLAVFFADVAYGFVLGFPGSVANYKLSGADWKSSLTLGFWVSCWGCWASPVTGALYDTFNALDTDDPKVIARAPVWIQKTLLNRIPLRTRKKLIWVFLAASVLLTAAIYTFAPGGFLNHR
jgi:hypothetical protein